MKKQSDKAILTFIRELPGGNVPQYAKLLNTTAQRLNVLLHSTEGQKLVKAGMICAAEKGMWPSWAKAKTKRGSLRAADVDRMYRNGTLPSFIEKLLNAVHENFRDDALNFLREALEHSSNHSSFQATIKSYMDQDRHRTDTIIEGQLRVEQLTGEITRFDRILEQARGMAGFIEFQQTRQEEAKRIGTVDSNETEAAAGIA